MLRGLLGTKIGQSRVFTEDGQSHAVTLITAGPCWVTQVKTGDKDGYSAVQLGFGKAGIKKTPRFLVEVQNKGEEEPAEEKLKVGEEIRVEQVFKVGDKVKVSGVSKGKGFAGVVKRWGFKGGPRTHGQSDRERAPGSIGQTTTPGRVFKGKKMAGRMGGDKKTVRGLKVMQIDKEKNLLVLSGLIPGAKGGLVKIYNES